VIKGNQARARTLSLSLSLSLSLLARGSRIRKRVVARCGSCGSSFLQVEPAFGEAAEPNNDRFLPFFRPFSDRENGRRRDGTGEDGAARAPDMQSAT